MGQKHTKSARNAKRRGRVTPSREPAAIGWVCCAIFAVVLILCILNRTERNICLLFGGLILLTIPLMMTVNIRIKYDEEKGFVYRNLFGISKRYRWQDITDIREVPCFRLRRRGRNHPKDTLIVIGKKRIRVCQEAHHSEHFINIARQYAARKENASCR